MISVEPWRDIWSTWLLFPEQASIFVGSMIMFKSIRKPDCRNDQDTLGHSFPYYLPHFMWIVFHYWLSISLWIPHKNIFLISFSLNYLESIDAHACISITWASIVKAYHVWNPVIALFFELKIATHNLYMQWLMLDANWFDKLW